MSVFYSEHDPQAAAWLRELIRDGLIPDGVVDERDIRDVAADDLRGHRSVHLFAGVGGWPYALRLAGWPDDRPVWTGSCPCQPYSSAGKGLGDADPRNLWPEMYRLVRECRPVVCFGEQVEGAVRHGWLDGVCADLEGEGYAVGAAVLGAHSAGAPHIRQRLYWVADSGRQRAWWNSGRGAVDGRVGDPDGPGPFTGRARPAADGHGRAAVADGSVGVALGDAGSPGPQAPERGELRGAWRREEGGAVGEPSRSFWADYDLIPCRDGKARRVEPGSFPLADGVPGRVGLLRGYGNAICPQTAAIFVQAVIDVTEGGGDR